MKPPDLPTDIESKVKSALEENGLLVLFRIRNNRVDYSIMNRPEPTLTEVSDHLLATAIIEAIKTFSFSRENPKYENEKIERSDGRSVVYKHHVDIDWNDNAVRASKGRDTVLQVMSIVVTNLMSETKPPDAKQYN